MTRKFSDWTRRNRGGGEKRNFKKEEGWSKRRGGGGGGVLNGGTDDWRRSTKYDPDVLMRWRGRQTLPQRVEALREG